MEQERNNALFAGISRPARGQCLLLRLHHIRQIQFVFRDGPGDDRCRWTSRTIHAYIARQKGVRE